MKNSIKYIYLEGYNFNSTTDQEDDVVLLKKFDDMQQAYAFSMQRFASNLHVDAQIDADGCWSICNSNGSTLQGIIKFMPASHC